MLLLTSLAHADVPVGDAGIYTTGDLRWIGALPPALVVDDVVMKPTALPSTSYGTV